MSFVVGRCCEICELCSQWRALRPEGLGGLGKLDDLVEGPLRLAGRGGRDLAALAALEGAEDVILTVLVGTSGLREARSVAPGAADVIFGGLDGRGSLVEGPLCRAGRGGRDFWWP